MNALVQGEEAPDSVCRGIIKAENAGCDVIIIGRGGGSSEDLSAFNTEKVTRAVYGSKVPVISAVGHETDFTLTDMAADMRAPTPSAAAELASPTIESLYERVERLAAQADSVFRRKLNSAEERVSLLAARLAARSPENRLKLAAERLDALGRRNDAAIERLMERKSAELARNVAALDSLSPLKVLSRGYSLVYRDGELLNSSENISKGDRVELRFGSGGASAEIIDKW